MTLYVQLSFYRLLFYSLLVISYISNIFIKSAHINYFVGLLVIFCIMASYKGASQLVKIFSSLFILFAIIFYNMTNIHPLQVPMHLTSTVRVIVLLYALPFINNIFKVV